MNARKDLAKRFDERVACSAINTAVEINDRGLVLGAGTVLAQMRQDHCGAPVLDLEDDGERILVLLAAAYRQRVSPNVFSHIDSATKHWRHGDKALANIRLAFAQLPRLENRRDVYRLFVAEALLDAGVSPRRVMKMLGFDQKASDFAKYDPNEPRVAAG